MMKKIIEWLYSRYVGRPSPLGLDTEYHQEIYELGYTIPCNTFRTLFNRCFDNVDKADHSDYFQTELVMEALFLGLVATNFAFAVGKGDMYYNEKKGKLIKACQEFLAEVGK